MIVDATALPEQVTDDVITSAFRSAGQRCSALRLLCVQEDVADRIIEMIEGAARALAVGDPRDIGVHVGPVIDAEAKEKLDAWIAAHASRVIFRHRAPADGTFVAPAIIALDRARDLKEEVFGPVLHVVRWRAGELDALLDDIAASGYGSRSASTRASTTPAEHIVARLANGNVYVNRNMIGAVVGTQPFGGSGLSGTGPKAGGPNYLRRFATEQVVTVNTAAAGGNASAAGGRGVENLQRRLSPRMREFACKTLRFCHSSMCGTVQCHSVELRHACDVMLSDFPAAASACFRRQA
jgi:RHH-type proline utilization regulon transcriptional repressor/proline dehydrogenase/delta 1-pyrroline-5-carboxylate dehydrogenase